MVPSQIISLLQTGAALHKAGRLQEAARLYAQVRAAAPSVTEAWQLGGLAAQSLGKMAEAAALLDRALKLQPSNAEIAGQLGAVYAASGRPSEAEKFLKRALELRPSNSEAAWNLAYTYQLMNRLGDMVSLARSFTQKNPNDAVGWSVLGTALSLVDNYAEACASYERSLSLDPTNSNALVGRGRALMKVQRLEDALQDLDAVIARDPSRADVQSDRLFLLSYLDNVSKEALFEEHLKYGRIIETPEVLAAQAKVRFAAPADPERPLKVAFLSPDLRKHSVSYFLLPLISRLDKTKFHIVLYHDHFVEDIVSKQLKEHAKIWRNFVGQSADVVERTIRADMIDVIFDLAGHTGFNRLPVLARRVAPVQVTYLGYPNTTGLRSIDYRLSDAVADPEGEADRFCTERLVRFAPTAWSFTPPAEAPVVSTPPCLTDGTVTFGSFNVLSKVNGKTLAMWGRILQAVPGSRLLIKSNRIDDKLWSRLLAQAGIAEERCSLLDRFRTMGEHLGCYGRVDIGLDPYPYNGTTTTCEALWMGVPVVTLKGDRHSSRVGASLLTAVGHPEWIASDEDAYVNMAIDLAKRPERLASIRANLRDKMIRSPLIDQTAQAILFGEAIRWMWREYCLQRRTENR